jgi:hypothetical protein
MVLGDAKILPRLRLIEVAFARQFKVRAISGKWLKYLKLRYQRK